MMTASTVERTNDESATSRKPSVARYALILGGLSAFGPLSIDMYLPALPMMTGDLHSDSGTLQLTLTSFIIGLALGQLVIGPLSDSMGRRKPLLIGITIYVVASLACAMSPSVEMLIAGRAVQAIGAAAGIVIARATVRDLFSGTEMTKFFSMLMLVNGLAPILAPVIGGQILRLTSWRGVFDVLMVFGALLLIVVAMALPEPLPHERRTSARLGSTLRVYGGLLRDRAFIGFALSAGLTFAGMFTYISSSSFVLQGLYGLSPQQYSLVFGMNGLGIVLVGQLNGRIVGRFSERTLLATGLFTTTFAGLLLMMGALLNLGLPFLLPPLFIVVASIGLVMPNASSLALAEHPRTAGSASALLGVMQFTIGGIASPVLGALGASSAVPMAAVMASFGVLAVASFILGARSANRIDKAAETVR